MIIEFFVRIIYYTPMNTSERTCDDGFVTGCCAGLFLRWSGFFAGTGLDHSYGVYYTETKLKLA